MVNIPTVTMWNKDGQKAIVNAGDKATQEKFRELGFEVESTIRKGLPEGCEDMAMEDIFTQMKEGKITPPPPAPSDEPKKEEAPPDMTPEDKEAIDQTIGQAEPSSEEARKETTAEATTAEVTNAKKKSGRKKK